MTIIRPTLLAPSILTADFARLGEEVRAAERGVIVCGPSWVMLPKWSYARFTNRPSFLWMYISCCRTRIRICRLLLMPAPLH